MLHGHTHTHTSLVFIVASLKNDAKEFDPTNSHSEFCTNHQGIVAAILESPAISGYIWKSVKLTKTECCVTYPFEPWYYLLKRPYPLDFAQLSKAPEITGTNDWEMGKLQNKLNFRVVVTEEIQRKSISQK